MAQPTFASAMSKLTYEEAEERHRHVIQRGGLPLQRVEKPRSTVGNEPVQMISEAGQIIPRVVPSVKQIERTKPKRLVDSNYQETSGSEGSAEKGGQRRGRSGGVGWRKDLREIHHGEQPVVIPEASPLRNPSQKGEETVDYNRNIRKVSDGYGATKEIPSRRTDKQHYSDNRESSNEYGHVKEIPSRVTDKSHYSHNTREIINKPDTNVSQKSSGSNSSSSSSSSTELKKNYDELRQEIEQLKHEIKDAREKKAKRTEQENQRLQPLSSQSLNVQGLVSSTHDVSRTSTDPRRSSFLHDGYKEGSFGSSRDLYKNLSKSKEDIVQQQKNSSVFSVSNDVANKERKPTHSFSQPSDKNKIDPSKYKISTLTRMTSNSVPPNKDYKSQGRDVPNNKSNSTDAKDLRRRKGFLQQNITSSQRTVAHRGKGVSLPHPRYKKSKSKREDPARKSTKKCNPCRGCLHKVMTSRSSSLLLLPFHLFLLGALVLYLLAGTLVIMQVSKNLMTKAPFTLFFRCFSIP